MCVESFLRDAAKEYMLSFSDLKREYDDTFFPNNSFFPDSVS